MKVAILTTDNREHYKDYQAGVPYFGTAPEALLQGFARLMDPAGRSRRREEADLEIHVISCARARMSSAEKIGPNIFFHGLYVGKMGWMRTLYLGCIRATRKKLQEIRPDIVHGQGTERDCAISAVLSGFPNVLTIHGNMRLIANVNQSPPFSFLWLAARLESFTIPRSQGVVCITHYTQDAVRPLAKRTWVAHNAVDATFFEVNSAPPADAPPSILCVGHISPRKNQNSFIRALDPLAQERKFKMIFLGQTVTGRAYDDEFLDLVRTRSWCEYGGMANRERLKQYLREASLLALPSLEDNCPMVVLEAQAAGVPVVAAKVGGVPDLVEEGQTGFLCDPLDANSMREAVEKALLNSGAARGLAVRAKLRARERFHPEVIARQHLEIYAEVLR